MKRVLTVLVIIVLSMALLLACTHAEDKKQSKVENDAEKPMVEKKSEVTTFVTETGEEIFFETGIYYDKFQVGWKNAYATYDNAAVPNKEVALEIATAIFNGMEKNAEVQRYIPQMVFYDEQEDVWVVCFFEPSNGDIYMLGSEVNIAIQKSDGKVLRIWYR